MNESPKFKVFNTETQKAEFISEDGLQDAILSEKYGLPKNLAVPVIGPDGTHGTVDASEALNAFKTGFKYETTTAKQARLRKEQAEASPVQSFAEGAASGLSFGISDQVLKGLGVEEQDLKARRDTTPGFAGEIAGTVAPVITSGGTSLIGKAVGSAGKAVRGVDKAARASEKLVEKAFTRVASEAGNPKLAAKLSKKLVERGAGGAVEGAAYGVGELIREDALGEADFNAEALLSSVGTGAVLGGAIGAAFGGVEALAPLAVKAKDAIASKSGGLARRYLDPRKAGAEMAGITPAEYSKINALNPKLFDENLEFLKENLDNVLQSDESLVALYQKSHAAAGQKINTTLTKTQKALSDAGVQLSREKAYRPIVNKIDGIIEQYAGSPGFKEFVKKLKKHKNSYEKLATKNTSLNLKELQQFRQHADQLINFSKRNADRPLLQQAATEARRSLRTTIDEIAEQASTLGPGYENLAKDLKSANRDFFVTSFFKDKISKKLDRKQLISFGDIVSTGIGYAAGGPVGVLIAGSRKLLESDFRRKFVVLREIEKGQLKFNKLLNNSVKALTKTGKAIKIGTTKSLVDLQIATDLQTGKKPKSREQAYQNTIKLLDKFEQDPEFALRRVNSSAARVSQAAPNTAVEAQNTLIRAMQFLSSKKPKQTSRAGVLQMLAPQVKIPSSMELAKFENYAKVVNDPKVALEEVATGQLTRESVEALKSVYPAIYAKVQERVMETVGENPDAFDYAQKVQLGILLDVPTDTSLLPENVMALQQTFVSEEESQGGESSGAVNPTQGALSKVNTADRSLTDVERVRKG